MDGGHHRPSVACAPQRGAARAGASRSSQDRAAATAIADRRLSALHPPDVGDVPDADGQPPPCDGARAWLSRQPRPFPPPDRLPSAATESRSLSASAQPAWRTSAGGLGPLWPPPDRPSAAAVDGVRDGAELLAPDLSALLPGRPNGELPARPCRRLRPVAVARGNEKGRVERAIRYVRDSFFAARSFVDLDDLNAQADTWCIGPAADRRCPDEPQRTVRAAFAEEAGRLLALPDNPAPLLERVTVSVGKTPYVRFDLNDYSIPHTHVRRVLSVLADPHEVRIVDGAEVLAVHRRSYDKGAQVEVAAHVQALVEQKRAARQHRANDRLAHAVPASQTLLARAAERGANLGAITSALIRLLDRNSAADLQAAILEALERDVPHPNAVRLALERRREQRGQAPQVDLALPEHVQRRDAPVLPHALETYDQLKERSDD